MTTYVSLMNYTPQGLHEIRRSPERLDAARKDLEEMGGKILDFYLLMGEFDALLVYEAVDDAVSARFQLLLGSKGNVRTHTMKAFPEAAFREIIRSIR